jgi:hypothetical protein
VNAATDLAHVLARAYEDTEGHNAGCSAVRTRDTRQVIVAETATGAVTFVNWLGVLYAVTIIPHAGPVPAGDTVTVPRSDLEQLVDRYEHEMCDGSGNDLVERTRAVLNPGLEDDLRIIRKYSQGEEGT